MVVPRTGGVPSPGLVSDGVGRQDVRVGTPKVLETLTIRLGTSLPSCLPPESRVTTPLTGPVDRSTT